MFRLTNVRLSILLLAVPLTWLLATSIPEVLRDRIFPFDSALIAANGALFQRLFADIGQFFAAPADWLWGYYDQYPALSVRRHPPLFGFVAGIMYSIVGVSAVSAKLTVMLFGMVFATGVYFVARRLVDNPFVAAAGTLLVVATPQFALHFRSVWLDVPSLAFAIWVFYFYLDRLNGDLSMRPLVGMTAFTALALYTYQPTVILLVGVYLHLIYVERLTFYRDGKLWAAAAGLVLLMLPLIVFTLYFARDNLLATTGEIPSEWKEFDSPTYADWMIRNKLSLAYWTEYARILLASFPVQMAGLVLWGLLRFIRKPTSSETLMLACFVITYVAFSWLVVKGHRYTLYMMLPVSLLTVTAVIDVLRSRGFDAARAGVVTATAVGVVAVLQGLLVNMYAPYRYLSEMQQPAAHILERDADASILYSGRNDAAFVFYVRSLDATGSARVHRASVQVESPEDLSDYLRSEQINYIVLERDNPGYDTLEIIDQFRGAILGLVDQGGGFRPDAEFRLPYGATDAEGQVSVQVFARAN